MSDAALWNEMARHAEDAAGRLATSRYGVVTSYDPDTHAAKVILQPSGIETGFLPIKSAWVGNGWGLFSPPSIGDQVGVSFQEGSLEAGFITGGFYSDVDRPLPAPSGEFWLVHQGGASLKFTNDGKVTLTAPAKLFVVGDLDVSGDITDQTVGGNTVTLAALRADYNAHTHPDVQAGSGSTGTTSNPAT